MLLADARHATVGEDLSRTFIFYIVLPLLKRKEIQKNVTFQASVAETSFLVVERDR